MRMAPNQLDPGPFSFLTLIHQPYLVVLSGVVDIEDVFDMDVESVLVVEDESVVIVDVESPDTVVLVSSVVLVLEQADARAIKENAKNADLQIVFIG